MTGTSSNDNELQGSTNPREPDAHGQAAMLLIESLIHGLIASGALSPDEALEIVEVACEVKTDTGPEMGDTPATLQKSLSLLRAIGDSLSLDAQRP